MFGGRSGRAAGVAEAHMSTMRVCKLFTCQSLQTESVYVCIFLQTLFVYVLQQQGLVLQGSSCFRPTCSTGTTHPATIQLQRPSFCLGPYMGKNEGFSCGFIGGKLHRNLFFIIYLSLIKGSEGTVSYIPLVRQIMDTTVKTWTCTGTV